MHNDLVASRLKGITVRELALKYKTSHQWISWLSKNKPQESVSHKLLKYFVTMPKGREFSRSLVRLRDNWTCQDCGKRRTPAMAKRFKKRLFDVHHINGMCGKKSRSYDRVSDIAGMVTLCHRCHFNRPEHTNKKKLLTHKK